MDVGGDQSQNEAKNEASWVPMAPQKPNWAGNMQFPRSEPSANNAGMSKKLYYETMNNTCKGLSCQELLFQSETGTVMPSATFNVLHGKSILKFTLVMPDKSTRVDTKERETD
ncbi:hypothetical protein L484_010164 [Morus notabilis]|uniref:Uncharacterized protein n=1 Tax=Morus notabilis TaxID=981085 RepID=W9RY91_9ROSA|nr:hypothetical protein L484_010164 [Morus notabilis]